MNTIEIEVITLEPSPRANDQDQSDQETYLNIRNKIKKASTQPTPLYVILFFVFDH